MLSQIFWSTLIGSGGLVFLLYMFQHKLVYVPYMPPDARTSFVSPAAFDLHDTEEVMFRTPDAETIQGLLVRTSEDSKNAITVLYFHGNAGNLSYRLPSIKELVEKCHVNVFIISYRGYGLSSGGLTCIEPSEAGLKVDSQTALDYLCSREDINSKRIFVFGRSLGGTVGIHLASRNNDRIIGLAVENTFTSILDLMDILFPVLSYFKYLCTNPWRSDLAIENVTVPTLFLSTTESATNYTSWSHPKGGGRDELIPPHMMSQLHEKCAAEEKVIKRFHAGTHMDTWDQPHYIDEFNAFLESLPALEQ